MPSFVPLHNTTHRGLAWRPGLARLNPSDPTPLRFSLSEAASLASAMPLAFRVTDSGAEPVVPTVLSTGKPLHLVTPEGLFTPRRPPMVLNLGPFLLTSTKRGLVPMVDETALVPLDQMGSDGVPLFDGDEISVRTMAHLRFMKGWQKGVRAAGIAATALAEAKCLVDWDGVGGELKRASRSSLMAQSGPELDELLRSGALELAYAQRISMATLEHAQNIPTRPTVPDGSKSPVNVSGFLTAFQEQAQ